MVIQLQPTTGIKCMCVPLQSPPALSSTSRRRWLQSTTLGSVGLALGGSYAGEARSAEASPQLCMT